MSNVKNYAEFITEQMRLLKGKGLVAEKNFWDSGDADYYEQEQARLKASRERQEKENAGENERRNTGIVVNKINNARKRSASLRAATPTDAHVRGLAKHVLNHVKQGKSFPQALAHGSSDWSDAGSKPAKD